MNVQRWLQAGTNTVAVEVISNPLVQSEGHLGKPGLWVEGDFGELKFGSDESWQASVAGDVTSEAATQDEPLKGRGSILTLGPLEKPSLWASWRPVQLATSAERPIQQSGIPAPMEATYPASGQTRAHGGVALGKETKVQSNGGFSVDYDRVVSAHIVVTVEGGEAAILTLMPNEHKSPGYNRAVRLKLGHGLQSFEVPFFDSFSTINVEASSVTTPFVIKEIRAVFRSYPVKYRGEFECSDPQLSEIWKVGRWSTQICMQTHHLDSPHHQEPISDPGDYLVQSLINYNTFGEGGLPRQDLRKYAQIIRDRHGRVFHTSYALLWLQMLVEYWQHTGDEQLVRELAPTAFMLLDEWEKWRGANGLISNPPNFMFIDWVEIEGFNLHHPPAVIGQGVLTAFYYRALDDVSRIARLVGDAKRVERSGQLQDSVKAAFRRELWSNEKGLFRDGKPSECQSPTGTWLPADRQIETFSSQVNLLACAYGLAPESDAKSVLNKVMESGPANCQPYFMHFAFDALDRVGLFNRWGTRQMRRWKVVADSQTFPEMWDRGDLSHSWQCTPTYQLSARVLGVRPTSPGFKSILVKPQICDLTWAKGSVPTPLGDCRVEWKVDGKRVELKVKVPRGASCEVVLPGRSAVKVSEGWHTLTADYDGLESADRESYDSSVVKER